VIPLSNEIKIIYDKDVLLYKQQIERLKRKSTLAKQVLLTQQFDAFPDEGGQEEKVEFILQFTDFILDLILFPDDAVIQKLRELRFAKNTLKWMVNLDEIVSEINRLSKIDGLLFMPNALLFAIDAHLKIKFFVDLIEGFDLSVSYNNQETNIIFVDFDKRIKRREYNHKLQQTSKMDAFEKEVNRWFDKIEEATKEEKGFAKNVLRQSAKGNTSFYYTILDQFYCQGITKNKVYLELFQLIKSITKNKELLSLEEYENKKDELYDSDYTKYQIARVKKILQKK
jgi:hypothetical protein